MEWLAVNWVVGAMEVQWQCTDWSASVTKSILVNICPPAKNNWFWGVRLNGKVQGAHVHLFSRYNSPNSRALADRSVRTERLWSMNRAILSRTSYDNSYFHLKTGRTGQTRQMKAILAPYFSFCLSFILSCSFSKYECLSVYVRVCTRVVCHFPIIWSICLSNV